MAQAKPLIDIEDKAPDVRIPVALRPEDDADLKLYCQYAKGSSVHHVVRAALRRLFAQDKGFQDFKKGNPGVVTLPTETKGKKNRKGVSTDTDSAQAEVA
jgi:hypothetical protein